MGRQDEYFPFRSGDFIAEPSGSYQRTLEGATKQSQNAFVRSAFSTFDNSSSSCINVLTNHFEFGYTAFIRQELPKKKFLLCGEYKLKEKYYEKC